MNVTSYRWIISGVGVLLLALATFLLLEATVMKRKIEIHPMQLKTSSKLGLKGRFRL